MAPTRSKSELLAHLPPAPNETALLPEIRREVAASRRKLVVIDDDPTGVQTVHDINVYLSWDKGSLVNALRDDAALFFLLTNTRSMIGDQAVRITRETVRLLKLAAQEAGVDFVIASRSDSTLRGHYPAEIIALQEELGHTIDGHLLAPAFFEGGRLTIGDTHYVATPSANADTLVPASDTPFAQDKVFGYSTAYLPAWVEEKSHGRYKQEQVASISLELIRQGGPTAVAEALSQVHGGIPVVINAACYGDLAVLVLGVLQAEAAGKQFLYRTAAGFVRLRGGIDPKPLLTAAEILGPGTGMTRGGLVIVGSYVPGSTDQLRRLLAIPGVQGIELQVERVVAGVGESDIVGREIGQSLQQIIQAGQVGVIYTSRRLVSGESDTENLEIGKHIMDTLVAAVQTLSTPPRFLIAKGGITSHVVAQRGLEAESGRAIGQILPGVPVWRLISGRRLRFPDIPYIVFPGNVGDQDSLANIVKQLIGGG
jgi:uncharacterized protein YgbK (DUF1537 family)